MKIVIHKNGPAVKRIIKEIEKNGTFVWDSCECRPIGFSAKGDYIYIDAKRV